MRQFAKIDWEDRDTEALKKGVPVIASSRSGDIIHLTCMLGHLNFSAERDAEALASYFETLANHIRENCI